MSIFKLVNVLAVCSTAGSAISTVIYHDDDGSNYGYYNKYIVAKLTDDNTDWFDWTSFRETKKNVHFLIEMRYRDDPNISNFRAFLKDSMSNPDYGQHAKYLKDGKFDAVESFDWDLYKTCATNDEDRKFRQNIETTYKMHGNVFRIYLENTPIDWGFGMFNTYITAMPKYKINENGEVYELEEYASAPFKDFWHDEILSEVGYDVKTHDTRTWFDWQKYESIHNKLCLSDLKYTYEKDAKKFLAYLESDKYMWPRLPSCSVQ